MGGAAAAPSSTNYQILYSGTALSLNSTSGVSIGSSNSTGFFVNSNIACVVNNTAGLVTGGGTTVMGFATASTLPTTAPTANSGVLYCNNMALKWWTGPTGAFAPSTLAAASSAGTVNSQTQKFDKVNGTVETVSSAVATTILTYTTTSGIGGMIIVNVTSRATTTGTGIAIGNTSCSQYMVSYQNIAGTVTLPGAGPTLIWSQAVVAALTSPVITATASGTVITFLVANVNLCTVDSTCFTEVYAS